MKPQPQIMKTIVAITIVGMLITSCKKTETPAPATPANTTTTDGTSQQTLRASDNSNVDNESNQAMDDVNSALSDVSTTRDMQTYCNMTIDSSQKATGKLTLIYTGNDCSNLRSRSGSIVIQLPYDGTNITPWHAVGSTATITFVNYKVTNLANNKSITFNGWHTIKNVNGGGWLELYLGTSIVHKVRAEMQITFDDGTTRTWHAAKTRTFGFNNNMLKCTLAGDTIVNGYTHVAMMGVTRAGEAFTLDVPTPISYYLYGSTCLYKPVGQVILYGVAHQLTITYGVDNMGMPVNGGCPYGYKLGWTDSQGAAQQAIIAY
jgi:hypothetical protein